MQPVSRTLEIYRGDDVSLVFRLQARLDGETVPLDVTGSEFELRLSSGLLKSTADGSLTLTATDDLTELRWEAAREETRKIASGLISQYELSRIDPLRGRRTYLNGLLRGVDAPKPANGDTALSLTVSDADIVVAVTVDDSLAPVITDRLIAIVAEDRAAIETVGEEVDAAATSVETARVQVVASAVTVADDRATVETLAGEVDDNAAAVEISRGEAVGAASSALADAGRAEEARDQNEATIASSSLVTSDWATMQANASALRAEHVADAIDPSRIGTYRRTTASDPATPWIKVSSATVPGLDAGKVGKSQMDLRAGMSRLVQGVRASLIVTGRSNRMLALWDTGARLHHVVGGSTVESVISRSEVGALDAALDVKKIDKADLAATLRFGMSRIVAGVRASLIITGRSNKIVGFWDTAARFHHVVSGTIESVISRAEVAAVAQGAAANAKDGRIISSRMAYLVGGVRTRFVGRDPDTRRVSFAQSTAGAWHEVNPAGQLVPTGAGSVEPRVASLETRIGRTLDANGVSNSGIFHKERLARSRMKEAMFYAGDAFKLSIALVGDSKTERPGSTRALVRRARALYGDGGAGTIRLFGGGGFASAEDGRAYLSLANPASASDDYKYVVTTTGSWAVLDPGTPRTAAAASVLLTSGSATAAASVTVTAAAGLSTQTSVKLYYVPHAGAACRYRLNSGAWTTLDLSSGYVATLGVTLPALGAIDIEWVSGQVELSALRCLTASSGVVFDKLALGGSRLIQEWAASVANPGFAAQFADINPDAAWIALGTNDSGSADVVGAAMDGLIKGLRTIVPWTGQLGLDVAVIAPSVHFAAGGSDMTLYADRFGIVADANRAAFVRVQDSFPLAADNDPSAYAAYWDAGKHETSPFGMAATAATLIPLLTL